MGAWGVHFDECDGSLDFLGDVESSRDWNVIDQRIRDYVDNGGYDDAEEVIAALELVAGAFDKASPRLSAELKEWTGQHRGDAERIRAHALTALGLVGGESELNELWAETDEYDDWQATLADLRARLEV